MAKLHCGHVLLDGTSRIHADAMRERPLALDTLRLGTAIFIQTFQNYEQVRRKRILRLKLCPNDFRRNLSAFKPLTPMGGINSAQLIQYVKTRVARFAFVAAVDVVAISAAHLT